MSTFTAFNTTSNIVHPYSSARQQRSATTLTLYLRQTTTIHHSYSASPPPPLLLSQQSFFGFCSFLCRPKKKKEVRVFVDMRQLWVGAHCLSLICSQTKRNPPRQKVCWHSISSVRHSPIDFLLMPQTCGFLWLETLLFLKLFLGFLFAF